MALGKVSDSKVPAKAGGAVASRPGSSGTSASTRPGKAASAQQGSSAMAGPKRSKGQASTSLIEAVTEAAVQQGQLQSQLDAMQQELKAARDQQQLLQSELDQVNRFWGITKERLAAAQAQTVIAEHAAEQAALRHEAELTACRQEVKNLEYEQANRISEVKAEVLAQTEALRGEAAAKERVAYEERRALELLQEEQQLAHEAHVDELCAQHQRQAADLAAELALTERELAARSTAELAEAAKKLEVAQLRAVVEVEAQCRADVQALTATHHQAVEQAKAAAAGAAGKAEGHIAALEAELKELAKREEKAARAATDREHKDAQLGLRLAEAERRLATLQPQLASYEQDKPSLKQARARLAVAQKQLKNREWENEVLLQQAERLTVERDLLLQQLGSAPVQQERSTKTALPVIASCSVNI